MCSAYWSGFEVPRRAEVDADGTPHWAYDPGPAGLLAETAWRQPQSYGELTQVMARFLRGEIVETPAHLGPTDPETDEIVDYLVRFNRAGFMTVSSQPTASYEFEDQYAYVEGFAAESLAKRISHLADSGTLGVVLTQPRTVGGRGSYGDDFPFVDGYPSPRWIFHLWGRALSRRAFAELRRCWYVVAFDTNDRDPTRLWRNVLEVIDGPPPGWHRLV